MQFRELTLTVIVLALVLMSQPATAGDEPAEDAPPGNTIGPISIMLEDADVADVVDSFATLTGLEVTLADGVELAGKVTVAMEDAPWQEVLTEVLSQVGLGWNEDGGQILVSGDESPDTQSTDANPLALFERLIGGKWVWGESSTEYQWGAGRQLVKAQSYFVDEGEPKLVAEGSWFWHPGQRQIKGFFAAIGMPVALFDYTTRFEGDRIVMDLAAYSASGEKKMYVETWEFTDEAHYNWKLMQESPNGLQELMSGTFERRDARDGSEAVAEAELRQAVDAIVRDVEAGNIEGLQEAHLESQKFSKFGPRRFDRQDVTATNSSEAAFFGATSNFRYEALDLKIDVFGDVGIATYYPRVSFTVDGEDKNGSGRQTLVFLKVGEQWKIVHEHGTSRTDGDQARN